VGSLNFKVSLEKSLQKQESVAKALATKRQPGRQLNPPGSRSLRACRFGGFEKEYFVGRAVLHQKP